MAVSTINKYCATTINGLLCEPCTKEDIVLISNRIFDGLCDDARATAEMMHGINIDKKFGEAPEKSTFKPKRHNKSKRW